MSSRFYPRFVKGNPQLRIYLPDWKMTMIRPKNPMPNNTVTFKVDPRMTDWDVKNYLEKIYKVPVAGVRSKIMAGPISQVPEGLARGFDYKIVHITLPVGQTFEWPELFPEKKFKEEVSDMERTRRELEKGRTRNPSVPNAPGWFL